MDSKILETISDRRVLTDGSRVHPEHSRINPETGMQRGYVVLNERERAKGFVEPVRQIYTHTECGQDTFMNQPLAETYAREPSFYTATYCAVCRKHRPVGEHGEFVWVGTTQKVGTLQAVE